MDALGALNPLEVVEANIQSKVGRFLSLKSDLLNLTGHSSLTIKQEASGLLVLQKISYSHTKQQFCAFK